MKELRETKVLKIDLGVEVTGPLFCVARQILPEGLNNGFCFGIIEKGVNVMTRKGLQLFGFAFAAVLFSYGSASGQIVNAVKDAADKTKDAAVKTKDVTVDVAKKTTVVVTDGLTTAADKTKDATVDTARKTKTTSKRVGDYTIDVTENVAEQAVDGGRWLTVTTWDGTKWVSKKVKFAAKKTASTTKDVILGDDKPSN